MWSAPIETVEAVLVWFGYSYDGRGSRNCDKADVENEACAQIQVVFELPEDCLEQYGWERYQHATAVDDKERTMLMVLESLS